MFQRPLNSTTRQNFNVKVCDVEVLRSQPASSSMVFEGIEEVLKSLDECPRSQV